MVFKNFRFNIILRVIFLNITTIGILWLIFNTQYFITTFSLCVLALLQIVFLITYVEQTNTLFAKFLNAIQYDDFSQTYTTKGLGKSFDNLNREFNKVVQKFQDVRADREAQYHYLSTIVQHIAIGLLVLDDEGNVQLINTAAKNLLNLNRFTHIRQLRDEHQTLYEYIRKGKSRERELIKIQSEDKILHLAIRSTSIKLRNINYHIISIQDIQSELEDKEMEAWQNLIRVLTHEIINSVTPIASLSATINEDLDYNLKKLQENSQIKDGERYFLLPSDQFEDYTHEIHHAIKTIQKRSEGLIRFVQDFRSLTRVPAPNLQTLTLKELIEDILYLEKEEFKQHQILFELDIQPENLEVIADSLLLEQVLINLLKNALQALEGEPNKLIHFQACKEPNGKVVIHIQDNGCGISQEAMKNIFVPFFTTKKTGSGIGLSLSRQIMRLHGGSISAQSRLGQGTTFTLRFP